MQKEQFIRFENKRKIFEFEEYEKAKAAEENRRRFISTSLDLNHQKQEKEDE